MDTIEAKRKELTWTSKQIRNADPIEVFVLVENYKDFIEDRIKDGRFISMTDEQRKEFQAEIMIEWGQWSHNLNKEIKQLIKEHELFLDNDQERFITKQYNTIYLFWWRCNAYLEAINTQFVFGNAVKIFKEINAMNDVKLYFQRLKVEAVPKWLKQS